MTATAPARSFELNDLKGQLKSTWMTGDCDLFSRFMEKGSWEFFRRLGVTASTRLLDVGCGAGQIALIAARAGAKVTGCDIAPNWLERARSRAQDECLEADFDLGDAESLPYAYGQFDTVVSMFGAMFAPRPDLASAELIRVCRSGGKIAMANWAPKGFIGQMFKTIGLHLTPTCIPSPLLWGDASVVCDRLCYGISQLQCTPRMFRFEYDFSPAKVVEFFRVNYGPMARAFASLDVVEQEVLRNELIRLWSVNNLASDGTTRVDAEYLEVIAHRA